MSAKFLAVYLRLKAVPLSISGDDARRTMQRNWLFQVWLFCEYQICSRYKVFYSTFFGTCKLLKALEFRRMTYLDAEEQNIPRAVHRRSLPDTKCILRFEIFLICVLRRTLSQVSPQKNVRGWEVGRERERERAKRKNVVCWPWLTFNRRCHRVRRWRQVKWSFLLFSAVLRQPQNIQCKTRKFIRGIIKAKTIIEPKKCVEKEKVYSAAFSLNVYFGVLCCSG